MTLDEMKALCWKVRGEGRGLLGHPDLKSIRLAITDVEKLIAVAEAAKIATTRDKKPYNGSRLLLEADLIRLDAFIAALEAE